MKNPAMLSFLSFLLFFPSNLCGHYLAQNSSLNASKKTVLPKKNNSRTVYDIGVVLDLETPQGKMSASCIMMALADFYTTHNYFNTELNPHWRDSNQDMLDATYKAQDLLTDGQVKAIIGPQTSPQAQFMAELGVKYHVPILSFSATSPLLPPIRKPYFIRTALSDSSQVKAIAAVIDAFGWREVVQIYEDTPYGNGVIPDLTEALQEVKARVTYKSVTPYLVTDDEIAQELLKMATMQTRVFIVHLSPSLSSRLFLKANELGMMSEGYVWIITNALANLLDSMNFVNSSVIRSMHGVLGVRPYIPESRELEAFIERWRRRFLIKNANLERMDLNVFGLWAYDTIWALAKAVEEIAHQNTTEAPRLNISDIGPRLREAILKTNFKGLSGKFNQTNGQLKTLAFEIVNVIGKGDRVVGFWTPTQGFTKKLNIKKIGYSAFKDDLNPIIFPGESTSVPKGWALPLSGKKLRIVVPKKYGFTEFVNVSYDPKTNQRIVTGYAIEAFIEAIKQLPYPISYEFVPFEDKDGKQAGTYNDLIYQVYIKNFDAVVADVPIAANHSRYVDFTLPYTESGVGMVAVLGNKALPFVKILSWDVWLNIGVSFIITGFVVWTFEHRVNEEFRGPWAQQVGVTLWFMFSTLVFAHRERLESNWSRFVMMIWIFVMWILSNSIIQIINSLMTGPHLQTAVNDINDLIRSGDNVGYQQGSSVVDLLKSLNVEESKLIAYVTPEEYAEALSNGTVGAIFDEVPYLRLFLAKNGNCAKFKMVERVYKTDGFSFAFSIGSPLVADMSRAILSVKQGPTMKRIEKKWLVPEAACSPDQPSATQSNRLHLDSVRALLGINGVASILAFLINFLIFLYVNRVVLVTSGVSFGRRFLNLVKLFDQRNLSHHSYTRRARENQLQDMVNRHNASNSPPVDAPVEPTNSNINSARENEVVEMVTVHNSSNSPPVDAPVESTSSNPNRARENGVLEIFTTHARNLLDQIQTRLRHCN